MADNHMYRDWDYRLYIGNKDWSVDGECLFMLRSNSNSGKTQIARLEWTDTIEGGFLERESALLTCSGSRISELMLKTLRDARVVEIESAAELRATKAWLEDMRTLVFRGKNND